MSVVETPCCQGWWFLYFGGTVLTAGFAPRYLFCVVAWTKPEFSCCLEISVFKLL